MAKQTPLNHRNSDIQYVLSEFNRSVLLNLEMIPEHVDADVDDVWCWGSSFFIKDTITGLKLIYKP